MFIAHRNPHPRRRSEEREPRQSLTRTIFPPLRSARRLVDDGGYKHATPSGVKEDSLFLLTYLEELSATFLVAALLRLFSTPWAVTIRAPTNGEVVLMTYCTESVEIHKSSSIIGHHL